MKGYCTDCNHLDCICDTPQGLLLRVRKANQWTQTQMAEQLGYTLRHIQRLEAGRKMERVTELALRYLDQQTKPMKP